MNMRFKFSKKKRFSSIGLIILCLLIFLANIYYVSHYNGKFTINESPIFLYQENKFSDISNNPFIISNNLTNQIFKIQKSSKNEFSNLSEINIVFDASREQHYSIWDTGFKGYSQLAILLMNNSFQVSASTKPINETIPSLNKNDIFVLNIARIQNYTDEEVDLIEDFVWQGGSLLVIGEHQTAFKYYYYQNEVVNRFNMHINNDEVADLTSYYYTDIWIVFNSSFFNVNNITFHAAASINLSGGAQPIATASSNANPPNAVIGARYTHGMGRVICITDSEWLWNGDDGTGKDFGMGIKLGNNSDFALKIFEWLANKSSIQRTIQVLPEYSLFTADKFSLNLSTNGIYNITANITGGTIIPNQTINADTWTTWDINVTKDGYVRFIINNSNENQTCLVHFFKPINPSNSILFSEVNFSRRVDQSISGLYNFTKFLRDHNFSVFASKMELDVSNFDAVCISNPLENISNSQISNLTSSTRILVLGESYSTILAPDFFNSYLVAWGFEPLWNPINELLKYYTVNITHYTICDNNSDGLNITINPIIKGVIPELNFTCYQASVVNASSNLKIFAQGTNISYGENAAITSLIGPMSQDQFDIDQTSLIMYNSSIMAIGDTDVITNERGEAPLFPFLACWLKTGEPYVDIPLNLSKENIFSDNKSTVTFTSKLLYDFNGNKLENGTLITVSTDLGVIITPDEDPTTAGIQVSIKNGTLNFTLRAGLVPGLANISVYNFSFPVIGQAQVNFINKAVPILNYLFIIFNNFLDLQKNSKNFQNFMWFIASIILVTGLIGIVIIDEKLKQRKKISKKKKIEKPKKEIKKTKVTSKRKRRKSKFVRKKFK